MTEVLTKTARPALPGAREAPLSEVVVTGGPGRVSSAALRELLAFRGVLAAFALRAIKIRYKQAALGVGWAVVQPVLAAGIFAVFLGRLAHVPSEGVPYVLFALAGMVAWTYFSTAVGAGADSLVAQQTLLRKIFFPREVLPLAAVGAALVDLAPGVATLAVAAALYGIAPAVGWVALPLLVAVLVVFAAAVALALAAVNVYYRDVKYALPFVLQLGLFASPVVYSLGLVPEDWRTLYAVGNPMAAVIDGLRRVFLHQEWPDLAVTLGALLWSVLLLAGAYALFKRLERGFSDRV